MASLCLSGSKNNLAKLVAPSASKPRANSNLSAVITSLAASNAIL